MSGRKPCDRSGTYRLAALIKRANHARSSSGSVLGKETLLDQSPEVENARVAVANRRVTTNIGGGDSWVPSVTHGDVLLVKRGVELQGFVRHSGRRGDSEAVTISCDPKNNFLSREAGFGPSSDGRHGRALLLAGRSASVIKRRVGTGDTAESSVDVVVHNL